MCFIFQRYVLIVHCSGKLLHFTDVFSIDETTHFLINQDDLYSVCKFSAKSAYIERIRGTHCPKTMKTFVYRFLNMSEILYKLQAS